MGAKRRGNSRKVLKERVTHSERGALYWCVICSPKDPTSASTTVTRRAKTLSSNGRSDPKLFCSFRELREHLFNIHWEAQILVFEEDKNDAVRNSNVCPNFDCKLKFQSSQQMRIHFFDLHKSLYEEAKGENIGNSLPSDSEWCDFVDRFCFQCCFIGNSHRITLIHKYIEHQDIMHDFIKRNKLLPSGVFRKFSSLRNGRSSSGDLSDDSKCQAKQFLYDPDTKPKCARKMSMDPSQTPDKNLAKISHAKKLVDHPQAPDSKDMGAKKLVPNSDSKKSTDLSQTPNFKEIDGKKLVLNSDPKKSNGSSQSADMSQSTKKVASKKAAKITEIIRSVKIEVQTEDIRPSITSKGRRSKNVNPRKHGDRILSLDGLDDKRDEISSSVCHTNGDNLTTVLHSSINSHADLSDGDKWGFGIDPSKPNTLNECKICTAPFWKASDNLEKRKLNVVRHLARSHFGMTIKMSFVLDLIEKGHENIQISECLTCSTKLKGYSFASDHYASKHVCLEKIYNEFLTLKKLQKHPFEEKCESTRDFDNFSLEDCFSSAKATKPETQIRLYQLLSNDQVIIQPGPCFLICKELQRCHECEKHSTLRTSRDENFCCQFAGIRKLRVTLNPGITSPNLFSFIPEGFLDPETNPSPKDFEIWKFVDTYLHPDLDSAASEFILKLTFPQFCQLIRSEVEAKKSYKGKVIWRRLQEKAREMCDVCKTTIFNYHWTCAVCGFFACLDCQNTRSGVTKLQHRSDFSENEDPPAKRFRSLRDLESNLDEEFWPFCCGGIRHDPQTMMLTQIIPGQWLEKMWQKSHEVVRKLKAEIICGCSNVENEEKMDVSENIEFDNIIIPIQFRNNEDLESLDFMGDMLTCNVCQEVVTSSKKFDAHRLSHFPKIDPNQVAFEKLESKLQTGVNHFTESFALMLRDQLSHLPKVPEAKSSSDVEKSQPENNSRLPKQNTVSATIDLFPGIPHSWLCEGRLLHLHSPTLLENVELFHNHWLRGQPVLVSNSSKHLDKRLWHPRAFLSDFGHLRHDLINCLTGKLVPQASLKKFWEGFEEVKHRFTDFNGAPMLLKLKDWPPSEDIAEFMPKRFKNLFDSFPLPEYTKREGLRNLAAFLPSYCLKPELGPKLYIAYGSAQHSDKASTNLHLDMSDAVNCLVYVSSPIDVDPVKEAEGVLREIEESGCDILMRERCVKELPGALWHIYHPSDTMKIRDFLNKAALSKNKRLDPHDDPIHDQSTYLDSTLRRQLLMEYGVRGYAIVQCAGDTVFIPAGACHQVRNLHGCIKVAEDFVSPENIQHCLHLTQEFRHLTEMHTNHEDKLQMKSILYHAVKSAITVLMKDDKDS